MNYSGTGTIDIRKRSFGNVVDDVYRNFPTSIELAFDEKMCLKKGELSR
jgi:hypothetical protein